MKNLFLSLFPLLAVIFFLSNGTQAQWVKATGPNAVPVQALVSVGANIFAGFNGNKTNYGGIYRSTDNGNTWSVADSGLVKNGSDTLNILSLAAMSDTIIAGTDSEGIFISTNNGNSWKQMNNGIADSSNQVLKAMAVGANDSNIYVAIFGVGVFVSNDAGQNWKLIDNGLPSSYFGTLAYINLKEFRFIKSYIYLIGDGTYVSTNGGSNWMNIFGDTASFGGNSFVSMGNIIFLGRDYSDGYPLYTLLRSTINGKSWTDISASFEKIDKGSSIHALAVYKNDLIVGSDHGVYISSDCGTSWIPFNTGWDYKFIQVNSLALNNNYIFAGTNSEGIWRIPVLQVVTGIEKSNKNLPTSYSLQQNYPNPFNPSTTIQYQIPKSGLVTLKVYDVLGREVKTLVNQYQNVGSHEINFNAANLSSGVYFYQLRGGNFVSTKKMILLR